MELPRRAFEDCPVRVEDGYRDSRSDQCRTNEKQGRCAPLSLPLAAAGANRSSLRGAARCRYALIVDVLPPVLRPTIGNVPRVIVRAWLDAHEDPPLLDTRLVMLDALFGDAPADHCTDQAPG